MKRIALVAALLTVAIAVLSSPPAQAQTQCGANKTCLTNKKTTLHIGGPVELDSPLYPTDTTLGFTIDGGLTVVGQEKVQNQPVATATNNDAGTLGTHFEYGTTTCASGRAAVTFQKTFTSPPQCTCVSEADAGCGMEGPPTVTAAVFHGGASSVIEFICVGTR